MPEVLMLARDDWANTGWRFFKCIQSLGIDILALKGNFHRMAYPEQIPIHPVLAAVQSESLGIDISQISPVFVAKLFSSNFIVNNLVFPLPIT